MEAEFLSTGWNRWKHSSGFLCRWRTQWKIVEQAAELLKPARDQLIRQAAQGEVLHNDDTSMRF